MFYVRAAFIICMTLAAVVASAGSGGSAVAEFFDVPARVRDGTEQVIADIAKSNPEAAEAVRSSWKYMKRDEIMARAASVIEAEMTPADIQEFSAFVVTPLGERVRQTFRENMSSEALSKAFASYPQADLPEINRFFSSRGARNALATLDSAEWHRTWRSYGELLMCRYFERERPDLFANVRKLGKCVVAQQAVQADGPASSGPAP